MNRHLSSLAAAGLVLASIWSAPLITVSAQPALVGVQQAGTVVVNTPSLNVRAEPSFDAAVVGLLSQGTSVRVLDRSGDGQWLKVDYQGYQAWVRAEYTSGGSAAPAAAPAAVPAAASTGSAVTPSGDFANVRSGPGLENQVVGVLNSGETVAVLGREGSWYKVNYKGYQAYMSDTVVTASGGTPAAAAAAGGARVTPNSDRVNVRDAAGLDTNVIGSLAAGEFANYQGTEGEWNRVTWNGRTAYVFGGLTRIIQGSAPAAAAPAPVSGSLVATKRVANVYNAASASAAVLGSAANNTAYFTQGTEGAFTKITFNGVQGFIESSAVYNAGNPSAASAAAPPPAAAAPAPVASNASAGPFELGAHIKETNTLGRLKNEAGADWVKIQIVAPGGAPDIRGLISNVKGQGLKVLIGLIGDRGRAPDLGYHQEFANAAAEIARQGADAIEVWNEPNLDREWGGGGAGKVNPDAYTNLLKLTYTAIKAANPSVMVIAGAPAPTGYAGGNCRGDVCDDKPFVERMAAAGAAAYMDCQGAHYNGSPNAPDLRSGGPTGDHYSWYFWGTFDTTYNAIGGKPICFTEMGYVTKDGISGSLPGGFSWGNNITIGNQGEWLARIVTLLRQSGRARLGIIWNWDFRQYDDDPQAGYSILRPDGSCPSCGPIKAANGK